jgi:hypothetical protein
MREVLEHLGINITRTTPIRLLSDDMVNYVKTVEEQLRTIVSTHQRDWDDKPGK